MKNKEIDKLTPDQLKNKLNLFKKDLFNIRFKRVNGQLEDTSKISELKKNVAKIYTKMNRIKK
jgi:large subunit ribosomal protein L29